MKGIEDHVTIQCNVSVRTLRKPYSKRYFKCGNLLRLLLVDNTIDISRLGA